MDRFIVCQLNSFHTQKKFLKSNMDRFIASLIFLNSLNRLYFKIQYGQIYRQAAKQSIILQVHLKSNMDRFIGKHDQDGNN